MRVRIITAAIATALFAVLVAICFAFIWLLVYYPTLLLYIACSVGLAFAWYMIYLGVQARFEKNKKHQGEKPHVTKAAREVSGHQNQARSGDSK